MSNFIDYVNMWYLNRAAHLPSIYYYQIHVTKKCQNNCTHCYYQEIGSDKVDIDIESLKRIIRTIAENARLLSLQPRIDFTGGDPFLYPYLSAAIDECRTNCVSYGFKCNPDYFLYTRKNEILSAIGDCAEISLSLDGMEYHHDSWRGEGSFKKTVQAAGIIKEIGFYLRINTTLSVDNLSSLIPLIEFLRKENLFIDDYTWARYWSIENTDKIIPSAKLPFIFDEYMEYLNQLFECREFYHSDDNQKLYPQIFFGFKEHQWFPYFAKKGYINANVYNTIINQKNCLNCTATKHFYIMDPDETIYRCRKIPDSIGDYLSIGDKSSFRLEQRSECNNCIYYNCCGGCAAMALSYTGDYYLQEPDCTFYTTGV